MPRVFSRALGCGTRGGAACTHGAKFGPRPCSLARALGVQSRSSRQVITGLHSASPSHAGQWKPTSFYFCSAAALSCLYHTLPQALKLSTWWQPRCNSSRTSSSSPFVTATNGASVCACLCHVSCRRGTKQRTHNLKRGAICWMQGRGAGRYQLTLRRDVKSNRAATVHATRTAAVHPQYIGVFVTAAVLFVFVCVCSVQCSPEDTYMQ